jgi:hypothetical protein
MGTNGKEKAGDAPEVEDLNGSQAEETESSRGKLVALVAVTLLLAAAGAGGGYALGIDTGEDLEAARVAGGDVGRTVGSATGEAMGYSIGFAEGRRTAFEDAYSSSFRAAFRSTFEKDAQAVRTSNDATSSLGP